MIVLHAAALEGQLILWGESPRDTSNGLTRKRGRKAKATATPTSPHDAGAERLLAALAEAGLTSVPKHCEPWIAWLPTSGDCPAASSSLIAEPPAPGSTSTISPWGVTAVQLTTPQAVELLCTCVDRQMLAQGVVVGSTLAFWSMALRFAGSLVARQRFLPGINHDAAQCRARWEPVVSGADASLEAELARAMPHACRALTKDGGSTPTRPAASILSAFLGESVDHLVRSSLAPETTRGKVRQTEFESVHDQWLYALRSPDGAMEGKAKALAGLDGQVREWRRPIAVSTIAPFRLCFRLEEPVSSNGHTEVIGNGHDAWYLRYLLQASHDPSLLIPVTDAWESRGARAEILKQSALEPREFLLSALGQASSLCPRIEQSLKTKKPGGCPLDSTGAHEFLTQKAWLLEQSGFGVLLPAWWSRKGTKLRLTARANVKAPTLRGKSTLSLDALLNFEWEIALGDQTLTPAELRALAKLKAPLVKVRGQWVQLSAEEIQTALDFWKRKGDGTLTARQAVQMALGAASAPGGLAFEGVRASGWLADLMAQLQGGVDLEPLVPPAGFQGTLRPYQERGYSWLAFLRRWGLGACLADDMGLGKTVQTLALIERDWEAGGKRQPTLLICPMSVVGNWQKEATRFTPNLPVMVHHGGARTKGAAFKKQAKTHALVVTSYALMHRDYEIFKAVPWAGVILDEAQNIKNPQTKQAQAARAMPAEYRIALTGTPVENHVGDLWSIMEFLNPGLLGTQAEFKRSFHVPIQAYRDHDATARLKRLTGPFILRRLKTDKSIIADLPEKLEMKVFCTLTKEQATLYEAVVQEATDAIEGAEGIQRKGMVLATLTKLKQVCNHPVNFLGDNSQTPGRSGKLARLTEMLEEALEEGDRALIFTQYSEMGTILRRHLQEAFGREVLFLHGAVSKTQRDRMVERFQSRDGPPIFVLSVKAGGTGLNLTAANHVFHFDRWWNPAVENQATDRAFRIGQTRRVQVHKFLCVGTLEERIDEMIEQKQQIAGSIVGTGEDWLTKLSTAELKDLFALRKEAIGA